MDYNSPMNKIASLRSEFPLLSQTVKGQPLIYLDSAATTQKPLCVIEAMDRYYRHYNANVHRASHYLGSEATTAFEQARKTVQQFLNAAQWQEIIWTRGTTEAINLVAQSWGRQNLQAGDEIILSQLEHHANIVPWQLLAEATGAVIKVIPLSSDLQLDMAAYQSLLNERTRLVAVGHASNALGTINPVKEITRLAHQYGAHVLIDGAQAVSHLNVDVQDIGCDFYAFSAHKVFGPTGIGALYGKRELLDTMPPWQGGGEMIEQVRFDGSRFQPPPFKFEAGTPAIAEAIGLAAAVDFLQGLDRQAVEQYEQDLLRYACEQLRTVPGIHLYNSGEAQISLVSFTLAEQHNQDVLNWLDQQGIALRGGHHCAMPLMQALDVEGTLRASLCFYNTREEVDALVASLQRLLKGGDGAEAPGEAGQLYQSLRQAGHWDARYRQLLLLGKQLSAMPAEQRSEDTLIQGCESKAWLSWQRAADGSLHFSADSDAKIIRGLLALILDMCNGQTAAAIRQLDFEQAFAELGLQQHLSPSRGNGLRAIVDRIRQIAAET